MNKPLALENLTTDLSSILKGEVMPFDMTVDNYVKFWLDNCKKLEVKPSTFSRLERTYTTMLPYPISKKKITDVTLLDLQLYIQQVTAQGYSASSIKKLTRIVTAPLKYAAANHWIQTDPSTGIKFPRPSHLSFQKRDVQAYTPEQQEKLKKAVNILDPSNQIDLFILEEGVRPGEAIALNWGDINFEKNSIHICKTTIRVGNKTEIQDEPKTYSSKRLIPITPRTKQLLMREYTIRRPKPDDPVFILDTHRIGYESLRWGTKKLCERAGVPYKGIHVFRHTFATNCYYRGIDIKMLSKMLGHASVQITYDTYINLYGDGFDDLNAVFG